MHDQRWYYQALMPLRVADDKTFDDVSRSYYEVYKDLLQTQSERTHSREPRYQGKIVLIGAALNDVGTEDKFLLSSGGKPVYGYQIHASVVSDLLLDTYPRRLRPGWQFGILLLLCVVGGTIRLWHLAEVPVDIPKVREWLGETKAPLALVILLVGYAVATLLLYHSAHLILDASYHVLGATLAFYWSGGILQRARRSASLSVVR